MSTILTKNQLEELLPDYAFGNLSEAQILLFEQSITHYPELQTELADIQDAFIPVKNYNFDTTVEQRTRNLSIRVNEKLATQRRTVFSMQSFARYILPALGLAACGILYFQINSATNTAPQQTLQNTARLEIVRPNDAQLLIDEDISYIAALQETSNLFTTPENIPVSNTVIEEVFASTTRTNTVESEFSYLHNDDVWMNFTETELQDIMKDLSYENPSIL